MTWSDVRAFVQFLPVTSHTRWVEDPDEAHKKKWEEKLTSPEVMVLAAVYDHLEEDSYIRAGQSPPQVRLIPRLLQALGGQDDGEEGGDRPALQGQTPPPPRVKKSPAEIRAQIKANERR